MSGILEIICPLCEAAISLEDVNVSRNFALCRICHRVFPFLDTVNHPSQTSVSLLDPPAGTWFEARGDGFLAGATIRTRYGLAIVVPASLFLAMFLFTVVLVALESRTETPWISSGIAVVFSGLGIIVFWSVAQQVGGSTIVVVQGSSGQIIHGLGRIGSRTPFDWWDVTAVYETQVRNRNQDIRVLRLVAKYGTIDFARALTSSRRAYLLQVIRDELTRRPSKPKAKADCILDEL